MKRITALVSALALLGCAGSAFAQFTAGNLIVSLVDSGDVTKAPSNAATQVRLVELIRRNGMGNVGNGNPTGQFYNLPTVVSGQNRRLTNSGSATSEGQVTLSEDGKYLLVVGYDAALGTASVASTASATVNRVVGRIDWTLPQSTAIDTTTSLNNAFDGNNIRGAASADGLSFFLSGSGGTLGGVATATLGASSATLNYGGSIIKTVRNIHLFNNNLIVSASTSAGLYGIGQVVSGATTALSGFPTSSSAPAAERPSPYGFYYLDADTLYVADDRDTADGGIQKWRRVGSTWQLAYTLSVPAAVGTGLTGVRGLAGSPLFDEDAVAVFAQLYAVTKDNRIVTVIDDNPGAQFTVLATGSLSQVFRGVEVIRPTTVTVGGFVTIPGVTNIQIPVDVEFRPTDGSPIFTRTVTIAADGTYTVTGVPAGKGYTIHVKGFNTLAFNHEINTFTLDDLDADVTLLPGDATGDNTINFDDFQVLADAYFTTSSDPFYDPKADFNNDGEVNFDDFQLLADNYFLSGEE